MNNKNFNIYGFDRNSFFTEKPNYNKNNPNYATKEQSMALHIQPPKATSNIKGLGIGSFPSVIYGIWDIGLQENVNMKGQPIIDHQLVVGFETTELIEEEGEYKGKRKVISKTYKVSAYEKANLMRLLQTIFDKKAPTEKTFAAFDFESLIGQNCIISVELTSGGKDKVTSVSKPIKGMPILVPENPPTPPKWVAELAEKGKILQASQNVSYEEPKKDDLPF